MLSDESLQKRKERLAKLRAGFMLEVLIIARERAPLRASEVVEYIDAIGKAVEGVWKAHDVLEKVLNRKKQ